MHTVPDACQIDADDVIPVFERVIGQWGGVAFDSGIVEREIQTSKLFDRPRHSSTDGERIRRVTSLKECARSLGSEAGCDRFAFRTHVDQRDRRALFREGQRRCATDSRCRARYECCFAVEWKLRNVRFFSLLEF